MSYLAGYGCVTAAGAGVENLWQSATLGRDHSTVFPEKKWQAYLWADHFAFPSVRACLLTQMRGAWKEAQADLTPSDLESLGVIFATTKGFVEDVVWNGELNLRQDTMAALLTEFLAATELQPLIKTIVSNACASSLSALWLAEEWLKSGRVRKVLMLAVDGVGPFVLQGFEGLHALTSTQLMPFAEGRSGLRLGEGAVALLLSSTPSEIRFDGAAIDAEGYAVTRPDPSGASLQRAIKSLSLAHSPDVVFAHGTATELNDATEDRVYFSLYGETPVITASKWCVGHTLAACGGIDVILAAESIRRHQTIAIANTQKVDADFRSRYLLVGGEPPRAFDRFLVCSLGFGGIHAAAHLSRAQ